MIRNSIITENRLDEWVRGNQRIAQGVIVDLVARLVTASSHGARYRRFQAADSIEQAGPDGVLDVDLALEPFIPAGLSFWEIGTGSDARGKATADYKLTRHVPEPLRRNAAFVFATPLSARRGWQYSWATDAQASWSSDRCQRGEWRDVRVVDGTRLTDWLHHFPAVELWLASIMNMHVNHIEIPELRWDLIRAIGAPPPLPPKLFLANRDVACARLKDVFARTTIRLELDARSADHVADFVCAYIAAMELAAKYERQAEEVENAGYHRLASTMRGLASSYRQQAEETAREHREDSD